MIMTNKEFARVIERLQNKDIGALKILYEQFFKRIYYTAFSVVKSENDAYDIAMNVIMKLVDYPSNPYQITNHIAPYTDRFDFYTYDKTSGDPYLELYDANRNKLTYNDDGNGDRNSLMTYNLVAGQKYYIHARSYNTNSTSYKLNVRLSTAERTDIYTSLSVSAIVENSPNQVKVYKFTAAESRYYTAYTNNVVSGDPFLELMSSTGTILATDNNGAGGINAKINFFLNAGESVYLIARGNDKGIENKFNLIIN